MVELSRNTPHLPQMCLGVCAHLIDIDSSPIFHWDVSDVVSIADESPPLSTHHPKDGIDLGLAASCGAALGQDTTKRRTPYRARIRQKTIASKRHIQTRCDIKTITCTAATYPGISSTHKHKFTLLSPIGALLLLQLLILILLLRVIIIVISLLLIII